MLHKIVVVSMLIAVGVIADDGENVTTTTTTTIRVESIQDQKSSIYKPIVVQYNSIPINESSYLADINVNARNYLDIIKEAADNNGDIIVFPEYGLTGYQTIELNDDEYNDVREEKIKKHRDYLVKLASRVPRPDDRIVPCTTNDSVNYYSEWLKKISCSALNHTIYVVINVYELDCISANDEKKTNECADPSLFNTNVVFDRYGRVIARQRKYHLHDEPWLNVPIKRDWSVFVADFDVGFVTMFDVDMLRPNETMEYLRKSEFNATMIYFSRCFDDTPMLMTKQDYHEFAHTLGIDVLVPALNNDCGGGIYAYSKEPHQWSDIKERNITNFLLAKLQKYNDAMKIVDRNFTHLELNVGNAMKKSKNRAWWIDDYFKSENRSAYLPLNASLSKLNETILCAHGVCCQFEISYKFNGTLAHTNNSVYYWYKLVVTSAQFDYKRTKNNLDVEMCGLVACANANGNNCTSQIVDANKTIVEPWNITSLTIRRTASRVNESLYVGSMACRINDTLLSYGDDYVQEIGNKGLVLRLIEPQSGIRLFSTNARLYNRKLTIDRTNNSWISVVLYACVVLLILFILIVWCVIKRCCLPCGSRRLNGKKERKEKYDPVEMQDMLYTKPKIDN